MTGPLPMRSRRSLETKAPGRASGHRKPVQRRAKLPSRRQLLLRERRTEQQALRANHLAEISRWRQTGKSLRGSLSARARADVQTRFAHQWAIVMANRDAPDFLARVAALHAEEAATVAARMRELTPAVNAERMAARRLLADKHKRERRQLRHKWSTRLGEARSAPASDAFAASIRAGWMRVIFHAAGRQLVRPAGIRLRFRRKAAPASGPVNGSGPAK